MCRMQSLTSSRLRFYQRGFWVLLWFLGDIVLSPKNPRGEVSYLDVTIRHLTGKDRLASPSPERCVVQLCWDSSSGVCQILGFHVLGSLLLQHNKAPFFRTSFVNNKMLFWSYLPLLPLTPLVQNSGGEKGVIYWGLFQPQRDKTGNR